MISAPEMRRCPRCFKPVRADRMIRGFGSECAAFLGLVGDTIDTGQEGPDLFDLLAERGQWPAESAAQP